MSPFRIAAFGLRMGERSSPDPGPATRNGERGIVLIVVLIVVALLTIAVTEFMFTTEVGAYRARNAYYAMQANLLARSALNIEESFLLRDEETRFDAPAEEWWRMLHELCLGLPLEEGMTVACDLEDESGKLNVNMTRTIRQAPGVADPDDPDDPRRLTRDAYARDALRALFQKYEIEVELVDQLREYWLQDPEVPADADSVGRIPDFPSIEEFVRTLGIDSRKLPQLRKVLTAQSSRIMRTINMNTVVPEVLIAILVGTGAGGEGAVEEILERQNPDLEQPFTSAGDVRNVLSAHGIENASRIGSLFGVNSRIFRLKATAVLNAGPPDEEGGRRGGIAQTLSVLVQRLPQRATRRRPGEIGPRWTLRYLDWQKEGGASLAETRRDEDEMGSEYHDPYYDEEERGFF